MRQCKGFNTGRMAKIHVVRSLAKMRDFITVFAPKFTFGSRMEAGIIVRRKGKEAETFGLRYHACWSQARLDLNHWCTADFVFRAFSVLDLSAVPTI